MKISTRLTNLPASPIRKLVPYSLQAKDCGIVVHHLNIGDPDIKTPKVILDKLKQWDTNPVCYGHSQGTPELVRTVRDYYHQIGFPFVRNEHIQITVGGSEAISMVLFAVTEPGDEVIVFEPYYTNYASFAHINGITIVPITTFAKDGFHLPDISVVEQSITSKTKAILICNPSNPTGTVYTQEELARLAALARKHGLFLISDEVYREFVYENNTHYSALTHAEASPDTIVVIDSFSKRASLCGARVGMIVSLNTKLMEGILRYAQARLSAGLIDQWMASEFSAVPKEYFQEVNAEYQKRRDVLFAGLCKIPGVFVKKPEGAFYMVVDLPVTDAEDFCKWLLTDFDDQGETVMLAPAQGFYTTKGLGLNQVRIAYVLEVPKLKRSVEILKKALQTYNAER